MSSGASLAELSSALQRLDGHLKGARLDLQKIEDRQKEWRETLSILDELPGKFAHPAMIPFGKLAFFPGKIVHTNEVLCQLSSQYFVERTTQQAKGMGTRRLARLEMDHAEVAKRVRELEMMAGITKDEQEQVSGGSGVGQGVVQQDADGFMDIREPCGDDDDNLGPGLGVGVSRTGPSTPRPGAGARRGVVERDADGFMDIREPCDLVDPGEVGERQARAGARAEASKSSSTNAGKGPIDEDEALAIFQSAFGSSGSKTKKVESREAAPAGSEASTRSKELSKNGAGTGNAAGSAAGSAAANRAPAPPAAAAATAAAAGAQGEEMLKRLRELELQEELEGEDEEGEAEAAGEEEMGADADPTLPAVVDDKLTVKERGVATAKAPGAPSAATAIPPALQLGVNLGGGGGGTSNSNSNNNSNNNNSTSEAAEAEAPAAPRVSKFKAERQKRASQLEA